jgi:hypothetical protein
MKVNMDIEVDAKGINLSTEEVVDYLGEIINKFYMPYLITI